jgi:hypothetical protein
MKHYTKEKLCSSHLEKYRIPKYVDRHKPIGKEDRSYVRYKDDLVSSHIPDVLTMNPRPRLPTKVSFKGGSHTEP